MSACNNPPVGRIWKRVHVHIDDIRPGDTIEENGQMVTICRKDIKPGGFMGTSLRGDSYRLGTLPVVKMVLVPVNGDQP